MLCSTSREALHSVRAGTSGTEVETPFPQIALRRSGLYRRGGRQRGLVPGAVADVFRRLAWAAHEQTVGESRAWGPSAVLTNSSVHRTLILSGPAGRFSIGWVSTADNYSRFPLAGGETARAGPAVTPRGAPRLLKRLGLAPQAGRGQQGPAGAGISLREGRFRH